ncbi:acyl-ACP desaturase [Paenimyroides ceti]|uniref:acyl-ACP desaturase n=1 Tax=Paenimyroides ceti TaxID=395087 RepID=UPI0037CA2F02
MLYDGFDREPTAIRIKTLFFTSFGIGNVCFSYNRVAQLAKKNGDHKLSKICRLIAGDEMRHHHAYSEFVDRIFKVDPSEMMLAFNYMMKKKNHHASQPYSRIRRSHRRCFPSLLGICTAYWSLYFYGLCGNITKIDQPFGKIDKITNLTDEAEKARDYLMRLPDRMARLAERMKISAESHVFKWVNLLW